MNNPTLHQTVIGSTGSGKSWYVKKTHLKMNVGVLYFNTILDEKDWHGYIKVNGRTDIMDIITALKRNQKLVYNPVPDSRELEFLGLIDVIGRNRDIKVRMVFDEVADLIRFDDSREELIKLGEYGRHLNTSYTVLSQRLQKIHKHITTQCDDLIIFKTNLERPYFKSLGIDIDQFKDKIREPYTYAHIKNGEFIGTGKI